MASVKQITSFSELSQLLEVMVDTQVEFDKRFPTDMSKVQIAGWLIELFGLGCRFYVERYDDGPLKFFSVIDLKTDKKEAVWHILYCHPRFRYKTKAVLEEIKNDLRIAGMNKIFSKTRRVTPSYKRFMASIGSYPFEITYKCEL